MLSSWICCSKSFRGLVCLKPPFSWLRLDSAYSLGSACGGYSTPGFALVTLATFSPFTIVGIFCDVIER